MKCPGQDTQFWKLDDIFEVSCAQCGYSVEFFKNDVNRVCPGCNTKIKNPRFNFGCAQWCEHAKECLGFDPKEVGMKKSTDSSLAEQLIEEMKKEFGDDQKRIRHALMVFDQAQKIVRKEGCDPRVVTASALLHDIGIKEAERKYNSSSARYQELEGPPVARRILEGLGFDNQVISLVCDIIGSHHSGGKTDTLEFNIIWDADHIINMLAEENSGKQLTEDSLSKIFRTDTGKEIASRLLTRV